jgi:DNA helicase-2/ATP-dependent DNA helicase PcrA
MFRIFGPPGTGKTTKLLNMVDQALDAGIHPSQIAFLAFTRKAANEAKERAAERFKLNAETDLFYFRTLHSLAYRLLNIKERDLMQAKHYKELGTMIGFPLNQVKNVDIDDGKAGISEHPILSIINLARLKKIPLKTQYNLSNIQNTWHEVEYVASAYDDYRVTNELIDYTDMLSLFVENYEAICPEFKLCFLDEAQDLSPLQWDIAHALDEKSERMYCAGDDDQAIYRWAGADVDHFINLPGGSEVLEQSYRIPRNVHNIAENIARRIVHRFPKTYRPKQDPGMVAEIPDLRLLDLSEGSWLIMAQANFMLTPVAEQLKSGGYLFERNGVRSISEKLSTAVNSWERLRKGNAIYRSSAKAVYSYMLGNGEKIARGKKIITGDSGDLLTYDDLVEKHGLLASKDEPWFEALNRIPPTERIYITALLRRGEKFNAIPRIRLSTIHGTKGGEAENVVLFTDLTQAALETPGDDLHRVFYVGVTRAMSNLFIVQPEDYQRAYSI